MHVMAPKLAEVFTYWLQLLKANPVRRPGAAELVEPPEETPLLRLTSALAADTTKLQSGPLYVYLCI